MTSVHPDADIETRVLGTTMEILREGGLVALTIEEVTKRSGVSKTTIYRRWSSAEELGLRAMKSLVKEIEPPHTGSLRSDLRAYYQQFLDLTADPGFRPIILSLMSAAVSNPDLRAVKEEMDQERAEAMMGMLAAARDRGEITRQLEPEHATALIEGPLFMMRVVRPSELTDADLDLLIDSVCAALA